MALFVLMVARNSSFKALAGVTFNALSGVRLRTRPAAVNVSSNSEAFKAYIKKPRFFRSPRPRLQRCEIHLGHQVVQLVPLSNVGHLGQVAWTN